MSTDQTAQQALTPEPADSAADWWRQAAVYQIYPRSFADSNGDGIGDLRGILSRVPYLVQLGVDAVWLSPFYPSALADGGYDVDDYRDVDPRIGTLADFDEITAALHDVGIKVIVDIVPNHSSDRHAFFRAALASPAGSPERDRYIFRDGLGENGELPPADWRSVFGGSAWEPVGDGQWYLHTFAKEQPDFNWDHPDVRQEFLTTLRFWSDRGVDGFRVDVAHLLMKDLPGDLPSAAELALLDETSGRHPLKDRDEVHDIYAEWRELFDEYDPPRTAVAEAWVSTPERRARYASPEGLGQAFNFDLLTADFDAGQFHSIVTDNLRHSAASGSSSTWVLSNHDVVRHATRYGLPPLHGRDVKQGAEWIIAGAPADGVDLERGERRARAATLFLLALPGSAYIYQGEELGLHEVARIPGDQRQDPAYTRSLAQGEWSSDGLGRDGCRVPLPWTTKPPSFGFGADGAHLPQPEWFADYSVEAEEAAPDSTLNLYRRALALRHQLQTEESLEWVPTDDADVLHFRRPDGWEVMTNFGEEPVPLPGGQVMLSSRRVDGELPGETTVWIVR
ncbi:glycoside hydrolase family 13 protein [Microbacterium abyssi]|uniref:glycoside hydrolase family 13 protein n=1 Tax=Microbacterium abyssi TaxID=2782166 RepID=UPI001E3AED03|nr:glycoside hydrolase family 13 protein [Microbacterium sp. A18JL241]